MADLPTGPNEDVGSTAEPAAGAAPWLPDRTGRQWTLLGLLALMLAGLVGFLSSRIAPHATLNPHLFTAHHSTETYRAIEPPFKPRLFAYLAARPFLQPVPADTPREPGERRFNYAGGSLTDSSFRRTVGQWGFLWMLAALAAASLVRRPVLWMCGLTAGVAFAYGAQTMTPPYDLAALAFSTWAVVASTKRQLRCLAPIVVIGTGFKETLAVFATLALAAEGPRRRRARHFVLVCAACLALMLAIDAYSGRAPLALESSELEGRAKISTNWQTIQELGPRLLFANAGLGLLIFMLPAGSRFERTLKLTAALFLLGLLLFAAIGEWRLWFELLPLNLAMLSSVLDRKRVCELLKARAAAWRPCLETRPIAYGGPLALLALASLYLLLAVAWREWSRELSLFRLSRPEEIQEFIARQDENWPYVYHPRRQFTLKPDLASESAAFATDPRGLAYLPPNEGRLDLLVLGNAVACGAELPYRRSLPGLLSLATNARVFSGATPQYGLEHSADLFEELDARWQLVLYLWTPADLVSGVFRETPDQPFSRAVRRPPLDLFEPRELLLRLTDPLYDPPPGLAPNQLPAWNRRRYPAHIRTLRRLNRHGELAVAVTYLRQQLDSGDRRPQRWLFDGLEQAGIPAIDTWTSYGPSSFLHERDNMHLSEAGSLALSKHVLEQIMAGRGTP